MSAPQAKKILLIGWDAADWKVINPLLDAGLMPALERVVNGGTIGNLATLDPPLSPMLWTSMATGKTADKHGILGFDEPTPDGEGVRPVLGTSRRVKAVWNVLNQEGLRSHVIGWWPSHPAEKLRGVTVSNYFAKVFLKEDLPWPLDPGTVQPESLEEFIADLRVHPAELTGAHLAPFVPDWEDVSGRELIRLRRLAQIIAHAASVQATATWALENEPWDFAAVYFDSIDHFGHGFMKYRPPQQPGIPDRLYRLYRGVIDAAYRFHDMMLERLLDLAGEDTTVILVSDHGFHSDHLRPESIPREPAGPAWEHRNFGILAMKGSGIKADERVYGASVLDITPTILHLFGLPVGLDMDGKPLTQAVDPPAKPTWIESWETIEGDHGMHPEDQLGDPWAEQAAMQQLVDLGYVEPADSDVSAMLERKERERRFYLARVYLHKEQVEKALPILEELYREAPDAFRYAIRLTMVYLDLARFDDAREVVTSLDDRLEKRRKKLQDDEKFDEDWYRRSSARLDEIYGRILMAEGHIDEALVRLRKARATDPHFAPLQVTVGQACLQNELIDEARQSFQMALTIDPDSVQAHFGLARIYEQEKRWEESADAAIRAIGLQYFFPAAHYQLGVALVQLSEFQHAAQAFEVSVRQAPGLKKAHLALSDLLRTQLNQPDRAEKHERFVAENIVPRA